MKPKRFVPLTVLALLLASCSPSSGGKGGEGGGSNPPEQDITLEQFNTQIRSKLLNVHNYTAHIKSQLESDTEAFVEYNFYNINDDAIYDDQDAYFYNGFIKQKNQGIVDFQMLNREGSTYVDVTEFYATNTQLGMSEFYPAAIENIFKDITFVKDINSKNVFVSTDTYAMAVIANLGLGLETMLASNPESFKVTVNSDFSKIDVNGVFLVSYVDTTPGSPAETFKQENATIDISIGSIGTTSNAGIEAYVNDPSTIFYAPTEWEDQVADTLKQYFNNELPPFLDGISYAFDLIKSRNSEGYSCASIIDYASGDLSSTYGATLARDGFEKGSNGLYKKVTSDEIKERTYSVEMVYHAPTDVMEKTGEPYGLCYPNGVLEVKYAYYSKPLGEINTVGKLKEYLSGVHMDQIIDLSSLDDSITVSGFKDGTEEANKNTDGFKYQFVSPSTSSGGFHINIENYDDAVAFIHAQKEIYNKFLGEGELDLMLQETALLGSWYSTEADGTCIKMTYIDGILPSQYNSKVQIGFILTQAFYDEHFSGEVVDKGDLESITLSGYKTEYTVGDTFSFNGTCTAYYENGTAVVTPTSVSSPDMSTTGTKEVVVTYTENGVTVRATYNITVSEKEEDTYSITVRNVTGATITVSTPESLKAKKDDSVVFKVNVETGYTLESINVVTSGGLVIVPTGPNIFTQAYTFKMPEDDVVISVTLSGGEEETFGITYFVSDGEKIYGVNEAISNASELVTSAKEGDTVALNAVGNEGFTVTGYKVNETKIDSVTGSFVMPAQNTLIYIYVTVGSVDPDPDPDPEEGFGGSYKFVKPMSNPEYNNTYTITFSNGLDGGTGTYVRTRTNGEGTNVVASLQFRYTITDGNKINLTLVQFDGTADATSYEMGYRLFTNSESINNLGTINDDGTITLGLVSSSDGQITYRTFEK